MVLEVLRRFDTWTRYRCWVKAYRKVILVVDLLNFKEMMNHFFNKMILSNDSVSYNLNKISYKTKLVNFVFFVVIVKSKKMYNNLLTKKCDRKNFFLFVCSKFHKNWSY